MKENEETVNVPKRKMKGWLQKEKENFKMPHPLLNFIYALYNLFPMNW